MSNREIDALCAEKVMGWRWWVSTPCPEITPTAAWVKEGFRFLREPFYQNLTGLQAPAKGDEPIGTGPYDHIYPPFSTDPAASKQLRTKMRADGWNYTLKLHTLWEPHCFECTFYGIGNGLKEAVCSTEEMAVALAALKAVGVQQEEE